jgi:hypothetical protein
MGRIWLFLTEVHEVISLRLTSQERHEFRMRLGRIRNYDRQPFSQGLATDLQNVIKVDQATHRGTSTTNFALVTASHANSDSTRESCFGLIARALSQLRICNTDSFFYIIPR